MQVLTANLPNLKADAVMSYVQLDIISSATNLFCNVMVGTDITHGLLVKMKLMEWRQGDGYVRYGYYLATQKGAIRKFS